MQTNYSVLGHLRGGHVREATATREAPFCVSVNIKAAHRLVKIREADWCYQACRADSGSQVDQ